MQSEIALVTRNGQAFVSSHEIAVKFGKRHADILRTVHSYLDTKNINDFNQRNFALANSNQAGRAKLGRPRLSEVFMTRDGFALVAMSFTGERALEWKIKFIEAFNEMERVILEQIPALQKRISELESTQPKRLSKRRAGMISVARNEYNLWGELEAVRYELREQKTLSELELAKSRARHLRKMVTGLTVKYDELADRVEILEGKKTATVIRLLENKSLEPSLDKQRSSDENDKQNQ